MTSTLYFYKLPINLYGKGFVLENISTYLSSFTPLTKSSFQFQRFDLNKTIKVNFSQDYQGDYTAITKYNYLKITQEDSNKNIATYYYFIKSARQVSQGTIIFELKMDTLNTFEYSDSFSNNSYTLSPKSLILREHKDRFNITPVKYSEHYIDYNATSFWEDMIAYDSATNAGKSIGFSINAETLAKFVWNNGVSGSLPPYVFPPLWVHITIDVQVNEDTSNPIYFVDKDFNRIGIKGKFINQIVFAGYRDQPGGYGTPYTYYLTMYIHYTDGSVVTEFLARPDTDNNNQWFNCYAIIPSGCAWSWEWAEDHFNTRDVWTACFFDFLSLSVYDYHLTRKIDRFNEGIETTLFKKEDIVLLDDDGYDTWYLIYSSRNAVVVSDDDSGSKYVNPVDVLLVKDAEVQISTSTPVVRSITPDMLPKYNNATEVLVILPSMFNDLTSYVEIGGTKYYVGDVGTFGLNIEKKNNDDLYFRMATLGIDLGANVIAENFGEVKFYNIDSCYVGRGNMDLNKAGSTVYTKETFYINSGESTTTSYVKQWNDLDITNPLYIKAINFPYCPISYFVGKIDLAHLPSNITITGDNILKFADQQNMGVGRYITFMDSSGTNVQNPLYNLMVDIDIEQLGLNDDRDIYFESKLYHSDFYQEKFVYDSFSFPFYLDFVDVSEYDGMYGANKDFVVYYQPSTNVQSKMIFKFSTYYDIALQDYENVLPVDRNNEKALFNNAYINYIRSGGFNHDTKKADSSKAVNGITTALSITGAVASFASSYWTHGAGIASGVALTAGAITSITRGIQSAQQQDRDLSYKMNQAIMQGTNVSGAEDIDMLKVYTNNNKAKLVKYGLSDIMKQNVWDLFHYFGYKTNDKKIPNVKSRINFNFVQGEIVLKDYTFNDEIAEDIKNLWSYGVTFFHYRSGQTAVYDLDQEYENYESKLFDL